MIEIRELVIRATVDDSSGGNNREESRNTNAGNTGKKGCSAENLDMILQIIKDKKER